MRCTESGILAWVTVVASTLVQAAPPASRPGSKPASRPAEEPLAPAVEALLAARDVELERYADLGLDADERHSALVHANRILEQVIERRPDDPRAVAWRFDWGRSVLYQEAEPYYLGILYRGGTAQDHIRLAQYMERTLGNFAVLRTNIAREFERMDRLAPSKYDEMERSGQVDRLEGLAPKIEYMERWAKFYRALAREEKDPLRAKELDEVLQDLKTRSGLLEAPHRETHVQAQLRLLAGMCARMLQDAVEALNYLDAAIKTVRSIKDERERGELAWVINLALVETIKLERDRRQYDQALTMLRDLQAQIATLPGETLPLQLAAALLEGSVYQAQAEQLRGGGRADQVRKYENMRYEPLMKLARLGSAERDAVYAAVFDSLGSLAEPESLHPLAGCALVAGLLADAGRIASEISAKQKAGDAVTSPVIESLEARRIALLDRAIAAAEHFQKNQDRVPPELRSEVGYGLAVAQFQRGRRLEAARGFLAIARDDPRFRLAEHAATVAVQIATELSDDPSLRGRLEVRDLQLESLKVLSTNFPESDDARYRQFFLAQTLFENGRFEEAARAFEQVKAQHEFHVQAAFLRLRALAALTTAAAKANADRGRLEPMVSSVVEAAQSFRETAESAGEGGDDKNQVQDFLAESEVLAAEAKLALGAGEATWILERLSGFEERYSGRGRLIGRVLRTRIIAYQHLERWAEAEQAIPEFVRREPRTAGATLQGLFDSIRREMEERATQGRHDEARRQSSTAVVLAKQIHAWASRPESGVDADQRYAIELQLAEALLDAEQFTEAHEVFARCMAEDAEHHEDGRAKDVRAIQGAAESLFRLKSYEAALPLFNRLGRESKPGDRPRFQALLRDLQCRTELSHPPEGIIKVIRQQKFLEGEMGGEELKAQFEELLKRNQERQTSSQ